MSNNVFTALKATATNEVVSINDLAIDPKMQMRTCMDQDAIEQYAERIEEILVKAPIEVVQVEMPNGDEMWYVVDGFHRYHAARAAELEALNIVLMKGEYNVAVQYAMSANWTNGLRPKSEDAVRSIGMLLATAPDFGYDSKAVNKWLVSFGVPASTARNHTKVLIEEIKAKRDAAVLRLAGEGLSSRDIEKETGIGYKTAQRVIDEAGTKCPEDKMSQTENTTTDPEFHDETESDVNDLPWGDDFDDDEEITPAINPHDAFNQALKEHEDTRQQDKSASNVLTSANVTTTENDPWNWTTNVADQLDDAFSDLSLSEMAKKLKEDEESLKQFQKIAGYMNRIQALL